MRGHSWTVLGPAPFILLTDDSHVPWGAFNYTGTLRPLYPLSPTRMVPTHIPRPDYAEDGKCAVYNIIMLMQTLRRHPTLGKVYDGPTTSSVEPGRTG